MADKKLKVVAIIQARMGSTRFPGKSAAIILDKPLLAHVITRVKASKTIDTVVVATTRSPEDEVIRKIAKVYFTEVYSGSSQDVLDRFYQAAKRVKADIIVRITADDPFKDPDILDYLTRFLLEHPEFDYVSNTLKPTYPEGLDIEVFRYSALEKAWKNARLPSEREHVTSYITKKNEQFKIKNIENSEDLSKLRWTIDYKDDLKFAQEIYARLRYKGIFHMEDILDILKKEPELMKINDGHIRNEGYLKTTTAEQNNSATGGIFYADQTNCKQ